MSAKTTKAKKFRSKFFRVAVEGATVDGRTIDRNWIEEAAASYDRNTYGARIWIEHARSMTANEDTLFPAVGDVLALKAEEVTVNGRQKLALFAQIEPTPKLVTIVNKLKQKIYTSVEITPKFSDTGKAYMTGLGVTDTPASLGTEALVFSAIRSQHQDRFFSAGEETQIEFEEISEETGAMDSFFSRLAELITGNSPAPAPAPAPKAPDEQFSALTGLVEEFAQASRDEVAALREQCQRTASELAAFKTSFSALKEQLESTQAAQYSARPAATGADGAVLAEF